MVVDLKQGNDLPKTAKARKTRAKILATAKKIFAKKGFAKTTAQDISKSANVGYGTFYLYFKDKKAVFYALVEQVSDDLYAAQGGADLDKEYKPGINSYRALRHDLKAIFNSFKENSDVLRICRELEVSDPEFKEIYQAMRQRLIKRTEQVLIKSGIAKVDFHVAAIAIAGMIESVANEWFINKQDLNFDEILPTVTKLYFKAVS